MSEEFDCRLVHPFSVVLHGITGSGKSKFVERILKRSKTYSTVDWDTVMLCYEVEQPTYETWYYCARKFVYHKGWPDETTVETLLKNGGNNIIIFDDLEESVIKNSKASNQLMKLFTVYRHHWPLSVVWVSHHLFSKHEANTCIQRNAQYILLMSSPRDKASVSRLGSQIDASFGPFLLSAYKRAVTKAGDFLVLDMRPDTPEKYRVRETVATDEAGTVVRYEMKNKTKESDDPRRL